MTQVRKMGAELNLDFYRKAYFYFDKPVPYKLSDTAQIEIMPISVSNSEIFLSSCDVIQIDKNALNSVDIIQMSYLDFLIRVVFPSDESRLMLDKFCSILKLCLNIEAWKIKTNKKRKASIVAADDSFEITGKQFDDIRRIILYQNIPQYDDSYIDPDLKKAMDDVDRLKSQNIEIPNIERRMAIITAHCGISKKEQMDMTYRSHTVLFQEVYGEVEFETTRPIMLYAGKGNEIDHWIYKKKKDKFDGYITSVESYNKSMGGDGKVKQANSNTI